MLIHGLNGSGKSTLAWIMAGLTVPTSGSCLLDGAPVSDQVGAVAISFQAARLQLMRSRVDLEVASAAGFSPHDRARVVEALATVGLDAALANAPDRPAQRRPDAPGRAGRAAGALTARAHPRRAAGRTRRRQRARPAAAAGGSAAQRRADRRRHLARLLRTGGPVPAHPAPAATACWRRRRRRRGACHDRARRDATAQAGRAAAAGARPHRHPRPVGGHETHRGGGHRRAADVLPGLGADRRGRRSRARRPRGWRGFRAARCRRYRAGCGSCSFLGGVTAAFAGGSPVIELVGLDLGLGGLLKFLRITALSIVLLATRRHGVVDHQRRRDRARRGETGQAAARRCGYRSTTGRSRWPWRCAPSRC